MEIHPRRFFRPLIPTAVAEAIYVNDHAHVGTTFLLLPEPVAQPMPLLKLKIFL